MRKGDGVNVIIRRSATEHQTFQGRTCLRGGSILDWPRKKGALKCIECQIYIHESMQCSEELERDFRF